MGETEMFLQKKFLIIIIILGFAPFSAISLDQTPTALKLQEALEDELCDEYDSLSFFDDVSSEIFARLAFNISKTHDYGKESLYFNIAGTCSNELAYVDEKTTYNAANPIYRLIEVYVD